MNVAYSRVSGLIREITHIDISGQVVITPFNEIGMIAKSILENCYDYSPIIVDDELSNFNKNIASVEEYANIAEPSDIIIICISDVNYNKEYVKQIKAAGIKARIKNFISKPIAYHSEKEVYFRQLKKLLSVQKTVGFELKRFGRHNDGGYVLLDDFKECHIAYSFGINDDVSWDEQIAENDIDVFCYDHTIDALPVENPRLHFNKIGIGARDSLGESLLSLDTILKLNNCQNQNRMILKMDVEGAEWGFVRDISLDTLSKFSQITFEFHSVVNLCFFNSEDILAMFRKLNQTHQIVWIHANNHGTVEQSGDIIIPDTIEITYANRNQYKFQTCEYNCPIAIDEPNYNLIPDIELEFGSIACENNLFNLKKTNFLSNTEQKHILKEIQNIKLNDKCSLIESQELKLNEQGTLIENQMTKLNEQNSVIESQLARLNEQDLVIESQTARLNEQNSVIESQLARLNEQNLVIESQTARLNEQNSVIENQLARLSEQNLVIESQTARLNEQNSVIESQLARLSEQDLAIESQTARLNEQNSVIESQLARLSEQDLVIESQTARLNEQNSVIKSQSAGLDEQKSIIKTLSTEIDEQNSIIENQTTRLNQQDIELQSFFNSRSWRITAPLRKITALCRRLFKRR